VIGPYDVYMDQVHVSATYATYLRKVLAQALFNPTPTPTHFVQADSTSVVKPFGGATLSGVSLLDATAVLGSSSVEKVDFQLSGGGLHNQSICAGSKSLVDGSVGGIPPLSPTDATHCTSLPLMSPEKVVRANRYHSP
jgi:hypothetical protein